MTLARFISIGILVMFASAIGIASFAPIYAGAPCCSLKDGTWIVTKTGKPASPTQIRTMQTSQLSASVKVATPPKPASPTTIGTSGGGGGNHK
jgi:hypothetical protein